MKNVVQEGKPTVEERKTMTPAEYFAYIKDAKNGIEENDLLRIYENVLKMYQRYEITGQESAMKKLKFIAEVLEEELPIVRAGYHNFVYRWDLEEYIESVEDQCIFIIEMKNYEREFPDDVIDQIIKAKEIFGNNLFVVYTDYSKKSSKEVKKKRIEKDPILFGAIIKDNVCFDRLYYICDWVDEYCDLTLEKLAGKWDKIHKKENRKFIHDLPEVNSFEDMKALMESYQKKDDVSKRGDLSDYIDVVNGVI